MDNIKEYKSINTRVSFSDVVVTSSDTNRDSLDETTSNSFTEYTNRKKIQQRNRCKKVYCAIIAIVFIIIVPFIIIVIYAYLNK